MHQSGHSRAHSMHTVQFSSLSAITPRVRGERSCLTSGYWMTALRLKRCLSSTAIPLSSPMPKPGLRALSSLSSTSSAIRFLASWAVENPCAGHQDQREGQWDEDLPRELLQLILAQAWERESDPQQQKDHERGLDEEPQHAGDYLERLPGNDRLVPAEEQRRADRRERNHVRRLGEEEPKDEAHAGVLGERPGDELGLGHGHVEWRKRHLRNCPNCEQEKERETDTRRPQDERPVLSFDDADQRQRSGQHSYGGRAEHDRQLVGDELPRRA